MDGSDRRYSPAKDDLFALTDDIIVENRILAEFRGNEMSGYACSIGEESAAPAMTWRSAGM